MAEVISRNHSERAKLLDELTGALIGLARASDGYPLPENAYHAMIEGLYSVLTDTGLDENALRQQISAVMQEKNALIPGCLVCAQPCGRTFNYDMERFWNADEEIRSLKAAVLSGLRSAAALALRLEALGQSDRQINTLFCEALFAVGEDYDAELLLPALLKTGKLNLMCETLLHL